MRSIRTIVPLALGLVALAVAGCQSRPDQSTTPVPAQIERAAPTTAPARQARPPAAGPGCYPRSWSRRPMPPPPTASPTR